MTATTSIDLEFADGTYTFALPIERVEELQAKTGAGIGLIFKRTLKGVSRSGEDIVLNPSHAEFYLLDIYETVRQGLIGGGKAVVDGAEIKVSADVARRLYQNYVQPLPLVEVWSLAASILGAKFMGYEPPGEAEPGGSPASPSETVTVL